MPPIRSVLVVDDDERYLSQCADELAPRDVVCMTGREEALTRSCNRFDLVLIDLFLDESSNKKVTAFSWGIDLVAELRAQGCTSLVILVSGGNSLAFAHEAIANGADAAVPKQHFWPKKLVDVLESDQLAALRASCTPREPISLARNEREYLTSTYLKTDRNAAVSAKRLQISRSTFYAKLRSWKD